ncbi:hypothetical protein [Streptomyces sp. NPDC017529]|uniref:hypothetical protein n=1 Tax=Streptomyces sp. NPDC017529 TaxID=3365000 RepID=UPI0037AF5991
MSTVTSLASKKWHYVLTLQFPAPGGGIGNNTRHGTFNLPPEWTRDDVLRRLLEEAAQQDPMLRGANILFFALEPNGL